ncbi:hypothetical protein JRQ81_002626 [Phrynocephalus forsythii]|uniref:Uncharacterized protein n=1 Tax=Phrynocephalus forsythii TaxID=171643 RepID=A0A9Q0XIB8_9SAUR|nr:hypothetical protein JRQ81_002626 [Phrynocephalus forsythii]
MKKEERAEVKVIQYGRNYEQKMYGKLLKKQEINGVLPWKKMERMKKKVPTNESGQQRSEERNEKTQPFVCQEASQSPSSTENTSEGFETELSLSSDSGVTNEFMSFDGYFPYYRTYANLVEPPLCMNVDVKQENTGKERGIQSNGCVFNPQYEDEPSNAMGIFATGYFPYYRTCEEYLSTSDFPCEVHGTVESEETETNNGEEIESEIDHDTEDAFVNTIIQENCEINEDTSKCFDFLEIHILTHTITEPCNSEFSPLDEILNLNRSPFSSGYFPYYRTYGKLLLGSVNSNNAYRSSRDELESVLLTKTNKQKRLDLDRPTPFALFPASDPFLVCFSLRLPYI